MIAKSNYKNATFNFFVCAGLLTLVVMLKVELPLLLGMNPAWDQKIIAYKWLLHLHAVLGSLALFSAPIQFFPNFRKNHLQLHRRLGRTYALSIFISAPIGVYIALEHLGNNEKWAAAAQGLLWLFTTMMAVATAMKKEMVMHQIWITQSYALTLTFVVSRFILDVLRIEVGPELGGNGTVIWLSTLLAITIANMFYVSLPSAKQAVKIADRNNAIDPTFIN